MEYKVKKFRKLNSLLIVLILSIVANIKIGNASIIRNGNFISNYQYWQKYQDDTTYPNSTFFSIIKNPNPYAKISIDMDINSDGNTDTDAYVCDLYQKVNFYAPVGSILTLSFDWLFNGVKTPDPNNDNDIFNVFFEDQYGNIYDANGNPGYIYQTYNYSNTWKHFTTDINYYLNKKNYYLTFELLSSGNSINNNFWQSNLCLDNININIRHNIKAVPEAQPILMFLTGLVIIFNYKNSFKIKNGEKK